MPTSFPDAKTVLEHASEGFVALDSGFRLLYMNAAAGSLFGMSGDTLQGRTQWEILPGTVGTGLEGHYRRCMAERVPAVVEHCDATLGKWLEARITPGIWCGIAVWFTDITDKKLGGEVLRASEE